ncbi:MAG: hypothetical protein ACOC7O_00870 [Thermoplasmatota archaeon]
MKEKKEEAIEYYKQNKDKIQNIIDHGESIAQCYCRGFKRFIEEETEGSENV